MYQSFPFCDAELIIDIRYHSHLLYYIIQNFLISAHSLIKADWGKHSALLMKGNDLT